MSKKELQDEVCEEEVFLECNIPKDFEGLDQTFRCQICGSLFDKAVTIKECGHTFCSVCIRNYWVTIRTGIHRQKAACPICRTNINVMDVEKALVMNRSVQEGVKAFKKMLLQYHRSSNDRVEDSRSTLCQQKRRRSKRKSSGTIDDTEFARGDENRASGNDWKTGDVELPVHKKMESRNYSRMKKRDLQKLCRNLKISTSGSEQELIGRLRSYQNMWNAEVLHSIDPKKPSDIAAKLENQENAQRNEKKLAQKTGASNAQECIRKLNASISSGSKTITSGDANFDRKFNANFKAMTAKLQARTKKLTKPCPDRNSYIRGSPKAGQRNAQKQPLCGIEEIRPLKEPTSSSIEVIDVESCSHIPEKSIRSSTTDMNQKPMLLSPSHCDVYPENKLSSNEQQSSSNCQKSSLCSTHHTTKPIDQRLIANKRSEHKKRRTSRQSSLVTIRGAWACGRCTYENKGIDYVCRMCGHRKS